MCALTGSVTVYPFSCITRGLVLAPRAPWLLASLLYFCIKLVKLFDCIGFKLSIFIK